MYLQYKITSNFLPSICSTTDIGRKDKLVYCTEFLRKWNGNIYTNLAEPFAINMHLLKHPENQCSGSMTFWGGSGSGSSDPCFWLMDPDSDPDPAIFVIYLQDASKKLIFNTIFSAYYILKVHLHHFSKIKSQKKSQNRRNQGFSYYFCMMIEGSGSGAGSGSLPLTSGSGSASRRPKNMWIRWIRIRLRIRNTAEPFLRMHWKATTFTFNMTTCRSTGRHKYVADKKAFYNIFPKINLHEKSYWVQWYIEGNQGLSNKIFVMSRVYLECAWSSARWAPAACSATASPARLSAGCWLAPPYTIQINNQRKFSLFKKKCYETVLARYVNPGFWILIPYPTTAPKRRWKNICSIFKKPKISQTWKLFCLNRYVQKI